ncbi:hypothetical protein ON010_g18144 [Phytophthora cinnamomi]|nr:hypothetical protein ON010_g18144 [Phytophthora cinnamomi]
MFEESMEHLGCIEEKYVRSVMRINFLEENGVDAGGLHREWFMMLTELLTEEKAGLFKPTQGEDRAFFLNSNSRYDNGEDHLIYFYGAGRLLGRALLEGTVLNFHLSVPLLKLILGTPLCMDDVKYFDPEVYKSMAWMLENDGVEALDLDFSVMERVGDRTMTVDLIPNGRNIEVTDANKHEYLERKFEHLLLRSVADQLYVFLKGIYEVIPQQLLMLFDYEELDYLMCGSPEIDVSDWEKNTSVAESVARSPTLVWFWDIVREMPNEYRRRLLQFTTGCSRVPLVGFKGLTSYDGEGVLVHDPRHCGRARRVRAQLRVLQPAGPASRDLARRTQAHALRRAGHGALRVYHGLERWRQVIHPSKEAVRNLTWLKCTICFFI